MEAIPVSLSIDHNMAASGINLLLDYLAKVKYSRPVLMLFGMALLVHSSPEIHDIKSQVLPIFITISWLEAFRGHTEIMKLIIIMSARQRHPDGC